MSPKSTIALDADAVRRCVTRLAHEIAERNGGTDKLVLVGILRRGATLASRLASVLRDARESEVPIGTLDISSYRDDQKGTPGDPRLLGRDIPFLLDGKTVILVDDVLYTGRTARAALQAISDLGRPESVQLAILVDRGGHQLPIRADFVGRNVEAARDQRVYVKLAETDGFDGVLLGETTATK